MGIPIGMLLRMVGGVRVCWGKRDPEIIVTKNKWVTAMKSPLASKGNGDKNKRHKK